MSVSTEKLVVEAELKVKLVKLPLPANMVPVVVALVNVAFVEKRLVLVLLVITPLVAEKLVVVALVMVALVEPKLVEVLLLKNPLVEKKLVVVALVITVEEASKVPVSERVLIPDL